MRTTGRMRLPSRSCRSRLPELEDFKPTGKPEPPLSKAKEWVRYSEKYRRETNTMPQWAGSCWYYLRYLDPKNEKVAWDPEKEKYWMPVDLYVGGAEHAVLHLLYSRFWHKVLFDRGLVSTPEPFQEADQPGDDPGRDRVHGPSRRGGRLGFVCESDRPGITPVKLSESEVTKKGGRLCARGRTRRFASMRVRTRCRKRVAM